MLLKFKKQAIYPWLIILVGAFLLPQLALAIDVSADNIIALTNQERNKQGLARLTASQLLREAAFDKAQAIIASQQFQHNIDGKKFSAWIRDAGYGYSYVGENLALDFNTAEGAIKAWIDSPTHKKNILNSNFSQIGVAVIEGKFNDKNSTLVVQIFGAPLIKKKPVVMGAYEANAPSPVFADFNQTSAYNPYQIYNQAENFLTHPALPFTNFAASSVADNSIYSLLSLAHISKNGQSAINYASHLANTLTSLYQVKFYNNLLSSLVLTLVISLMFISVRIWTNYSTKNYLNTKK